MSTEKKPGLDPIEAFLREESGEGKWDSRGHFTTAAGKALSKLAAYQLPRPEAWILKMVQAGVAAGGTSIAIDTPAGGLEITYTGVELGTLNELKKSWISPTATVSLAQKHLLVGLRAISVGKRRSVLVTSRPAEGPPQSLYWNGSGLSEIVTRSALPRLVGTAEDELVFYFSAERDASEDSSWTREMNELRDFAVTSPVPLTLQGERLGHFGMGDIHIRRKPLVFGSHPVMDGEPELRIADPSQEGVVTNQSSAWVLYWAEQPMRCSVSWIQHGVVCQQEDFGPAGRFMLRIYLSGDHLETDMTGLHLRFPEDGASRQRLTELVDKTLEQFLAGSPRVNEVESALSEGTKSGSLALAGALVLTSATFIPVLGWGALVGACGLAALLHKGEEARRESTSAAFVAELEKWRCTMASATAGGL